MVKPSLFGILIAGFLFSGCADIGSFSADAATVDSGVDLGLGPDRSGAPDLGPMLDILGYTGEPVVFAHSATRLYKVNPETLAVTAVGDFKWPGLSDQMTDIAIDSKGSMVGISFSAVYSVDPKTAKCTYLAALQAPSGLAGQFNGLSFVSSLKGDGKDALWAAGEGGAVYEINPQTGASKQVGTYGGPGSSGDLVSLRTLGIFATVKKSTYASTDYLASVDPLTGKATLIGDTGFSDIWGVGFWKKQVYGFTKASQFILIDIKTGKGTLVSKGGGEWWGAGVTTEAPVIE